MAQAASTGLEAVRAELAAKPDGVLEALAEKHHVSYVAVLRCVEGDACRLAKPQDFEAIWSELVMWGPVTFVVHTRDGVFETKAPVPPGSVGRGYFNIHGESPLGGHLKMERCAAIYFVDRQFFGRRSCSVQFINIDGEAMFKVFVGRGQDREMHPDQLRKFEQLRDVHCRGE